jgi:hypothetical protein
MPPVRVSNFSLTERVRRLAYVPLKTRCVDVRRRAIDGFYAVHRFLENAIDG